MSERELQNRLRACGCEASDIDLVLLTHEHEDHLGCAISLATKYAIPLGASLGTLQGAGLSAEQLAGAEAKRLHWVRLSSGQRLQTFGLEIEAVAVPHDAREALQFVLHHHDAGLPGVTRSLGILTDLGHISGEVLLRYRSLDALVIECNHHLPLLERCSYPASVKRRIAGAWGHLSNAQSAAFLREIDAANLRVLVAAHLSLQNNHPDQVRAALRGAIGAEALERLVIADQKSGFGWQTL
jgi:phosphoribosyl 1,2-cyclic phosphodiesterase